jgi:hypothetical protein
MPFQEFLNVASCDLHLGHEQRTSSMMPMEAQRGAIDEPQHEMNNFGTEEVSSARLTYLNFLPVL